MWFEGFKYWEIQIILGVELSYISCWEKCYREEGLMGIKLKYKGSVGYLNKE